jgi:hypothetical protein
VSGILARMAVPPAAATDPTVTTTLHETCMRFTQLAAADDRLKFMRLAEKIVRGSASGRDSH